MTLCLFLLTLLKRKQSPLYCVNHGWRESFLLVLWRSDSAVSCCESSEKECPLMILLLVKISIEHGFQISVAHSFVCSRLRSRRFFSQCAVHSSFCPQSFFLAKINNFIWFVDPYANARVPLIPICSDFSCFYRTTMAAWEEDIVSSLLWFTGSCSIYCMWAYFHLV